MSEYLAVYTDTTGLVHVLLGPLMISQTTPTAWGSPSNFLPDGFGVNAIAADTNKDGTPQVWVAGTPAGQQIPALYTTFKDSSDWTSLMKISGAPDNIGDIYAARSVPGRIQLFATVPNASGENASLVTTWQVGANPETSYENWGAFSPQPPTLSFAGVRSATLPDGRLQLWAVTADHQMITCYKLGSEPGAPWKPWEQALPSPTQPGSSAVPYMLATGLDAGGVEHLWCGDANDKLYTATQTEPPSTTISNWTEVALPGGMTADAYQIAVTTLSNGRLQIFAQVTAANHSALYTRYQTSSTANAPWSSWEQVPT
jgi:hypothetical protein